MKNRPHHFSIGGVRISLRSDCRLFVDEYLSLYEPYRRDSSDGNAIEVEIQTRHRFPWRRGPFIIKSEGVGPIEVQRRYEVLPHLEWVINWQIIRQRGDYVQLHAAALEFDGQALILPGDPGSGKSTLTAGLLARGWSYLCDEFALIDPQTLTVHPFPRALCMKEASFAVVKRLGITLLSKTPYHKPTKGRVAFLRPRDVRSDAEGRASRVRWVIFPKYVAGAVPVLERLTRSQAAYELTRQCFNFRVHRERAIVVLANVARHADCYHLIAGDIAATCDLVETILSPKVNRKAG